MKTIENPFPATSEPEIAAVDPKVKAAEQRKQIASIQAFIGFASAVAFGSLIFALLLFPLGGAKLAAAGGGGILTSVLAYRYPRRALWLFFLYMPFSGTVTYWLAGGNAIFQLAKDGFYLPAMVSLALAYRQSRDPFIKPESILPALWAIVIFCSLTIVFISLPRQFFPVCNAALEAAGQGCKKGQPFLQGILGLKVFLGYVPLIFCMQKLLKTKAEFLFFTRSHVILAIICSGLCLVQLWMLQTGRCAGTDHLSGSQLFVTSLDAKCLVGGALLYSPSQGVIRLPSTFVAPWQWGWFMIANAYLTFATAFSDPAKFWRLVGFLGMASITAAALVSGQRVALALVPISFAILLVLTGQLVNWKRFIPIAIGAGMGGIVAWFLFQDLILDRVQNFIGRWNSSPADQMIFFQFRFVWGNIERQILGRGLGAATNSCRIFGPTWLIETWFPKVLFEIGPIGLLVFLTFVTVLTVTTFKTYRSLKDKNLRSFGACFWVFVLFISYQTYYYPLDVDPVAVYYWVMVGAIFSLPELERQANAEKELAAAGTLLPVEAAKEGRFVRIRVSSNG
jgi:hypothetical protein